MISSDCRLLSLFFFFNDTATTEIYTLSLHDALPISDARGRDGRIAKFTTQKSTGHRSEEHTSELQSLRHLVCRLLLEKKKKNEKQTFTKKKKKIKLQQSIKNKNQK